LLDVDAVEDDLKVLCRCDADKRRLRDAIWPARGRDRQFAASHIGKEFGISDGVDDRLIVSRHIE
jgi:hypothetical protein